MVDEGWNAACQTTSKGVEGAEWEKLYHKFVDMNKAVNVRHPSGNGRDKTLWKVREAKENGDAYYDQTSEQQIVSRDADRQEL